MFWNRYLSSLLWALLKKRAIWDLSLSAVLQPLVGFGLSATRDYWDGLELNEMYNLLVYAGCSILGRNMRTLIGNAAFML